MSDDMIDDRHATGMPEDSEQPESKPVAKSVDPASEPEPVPQGEQRPFDPGDADDVLSKQVAGKTADAEVLAQSRGYTRRAFAVAAVAAAAGYGFYHWLPDSPGDESSDDILRGALRFNADVSRGLLRDRALAPTYPVGRAENLRVNGVYGLKKNLSTDRWRLLLVGMKGAEQHPQTVKDVTAWEYHYTGASEGDQGHDTKVDPNKEAQGSNQNGTSAQGTAAKMAPANMLARAQADENKPDANHTGRKSRGNEEAGESESTLKSNTPGLLLQLADITRLPRHDLVTQFKCIEGWSQIVHFAGVRMADFLDLYLWPAPLHERIVSCGRPVRRCPDSCVPANRRSCDDGQTSQANGERPISQDLRRSRSGLSGTRHHARKWAWA